MELSFMNRYDALVPITKRDGDKLAGLGCSLPVHVVPMGIDAEAFQPDHSLLEFPSLCDSDCDNKQCFISKSFNTLRGCNGLFKQSLPALELTGL